MRNPRFPFADGEGRFLKFITIPLGSKIILHILTKKKKIILHVINISYSNSFGIESMCVIVETVLSD